MKKLDLKKLILIILGVIILAGERWLVTQKGNNQQGFTKYISSMESLHTEKSVANYSSFPQAAEMEVDVETTEVELKDESQEEPSTSIIRNKENSQEKRIIFINEEGDESQKVYKKYASYDQPWKDSCTLTVGGSDYTTHLHYELSESDPNAFAFGTYNYPSVSVVGRRYIYCKCFI